MITSTSSSQVKTVVSLQKKAKTRKETKQFVVEGMKYTYDRNKNKVIGKVKEEPRRREGHWGGVNEENWQGATPSPDGKKEAFVSEGNLFVRDISSGKVNRLSYDGAPGEYYSSFISWSPDSRK